MPRKEKKVRMYSALEVAQICGVVNQTTINWIKNGHLKAFQTPGGQYRVYAEDLVAFLSARGMRIPAEIADSSSDGKPDWNRVLIVDDDQNINNLLKRYLEKRMPGRTFLQAFDGFEAGRLLTEHRPAAIILDIALPGVDGHELCRRIKADPSLGNPVIIAISGLDRGTDGPAILREGADAFFAKPLEFEEVHARLEGLAAARRAAGG